MKPKHLFISILAVLFVFPFTGTFAQATSVTIEVLATFDYPGVGNLTRPQKINDAGDIVGIYNDSSGVSRGFVRLQTGHFSAPIVEPNDTGNVTEGRGINKSLTVCGDYLNGSDGTYHSYFLSGRTFTEFDVPGALDTYVFAINDAGDFAGGLIPATGVRQAFISIGGTITPINISGSTDSLAYGMDNSNQLVGYNADSGGIFHGFYQDRRGTLHTPIDPPGSTQTILFGINDRNWMVGRWVDSAGTTHGLFFLAPHKFVTFDYPGAIFTSLNGINTEGLICGRYTDTSGIDHGILARASRTPGNDAAVKATSPSSSALPSKAPAL